MKTCCYIVSQISLLKVGVVDGRRWRRHLLKNERRSLAIRGSRSRATGRRAFHPKEHVDSVVRALLECVLQVLLYLQLDLLWEARELILLGRVEDVGDLFNSLQLAIVAVDSCSEGPIRYSRSRLLRRL